MDNTFSLSFIKGNSYWYNLIVVALVSIGLLPMLPNKLKPLPVVLLVIGAIVSLFNKATSDIDKLHWKYPLLFSAIFIVYGISYLWTEDLDVAGRRMETGMSLFLVPWAFYFIFNKTKLQVSLISTMQFLFFISSLIYGLVIVCFFYKVGYYTGEHDLQFTLSYLDGMLPGYSQHAIYASLILSIGLIIVPYEWKRSEMWKKTLFTIGSIFLLYLIFLLFRKGVIIGLILSYSSIWVVKRKELSKYFVILCGLMLLVFTFIFKQQVMDKLDELFSPKTFEIVDVKNSTSMRFAVYNCSISIISENPFLGQGIGDGYVTIENCLKDQYQVEFQDDKLRKNSHNQYLGIWLYTGIVGLILFVMQLVVYFRKAVRIKTIFLPIAMLLSIVMFTENILDRQTGVLLFTLFLNLFFFIRFENPKTIEEDD